jgi:hypothetical protein
MNFRRTKDADPDQVTIARYLGANGPTAGDELADALGMSPERFWVLINHPWFEITGKGWTLTDLGREEGPAAS